MREPRLLRDRLPLLHSQQKQRKGLQENPVRARVLEACSLPIGFAFFLIVAGIVEIA